MICPSPRPDPTPGSRTPVTCVAYDYVTPAVYARGPRKGERIPDYWFRCHVTAAGHRHCVIFKR